MTHLEQHVIFFVVVSRETEESQVHLEQMGHPDSR